MRDGAVRKFNITLTYADLDKDILFSNSTITKKQKQISVELDESKCYSPEDFCNSVLDQKERHRIIKLNVREKFDGEETPLSWISRLYERIYFHNGIPLIFTNN